jgi:phosphoribosylformylglycinamidine synthase PurS subunit
MCSLKEEAMLKVEINITLKRTVADPQGLTIKHALESLGYKDLADVRIGKLVVIKLNFKNKKRAEQEINEMCKKLLANPIIEEYSFNIKEL